MKKLTLFIAIVFSGMLMQAQTPEQLEKRYINSLAMKRTGMLMTTIGAGAFIGGALIRSRANDNSSQDQLGLQLMNGGFVGMNIGAPLWIAGKIVSKNNRIAMEKSKRKLSLAVGITNHGPGLLFTF